MSEDIKRVLTVLSEQPSLQQGVSVAYLSKRLDLDRRRALKIIEMLERAGFIRVQRLDRVILVTLSPQGYKNTAWSRKESKSTTNGILTLLKVSGIGLLVILIGFAWWMLDLSPHTSGAQPAKSVPLSSATQSPTQTVIPIPTPMPSPIPPDNPSTVPATPKQTPELHSPLPTAIPISTLDPNTLPPQPTGIPTPVPLLDQPAETVNIVLMGTDTTEGSWRTDTLIVVSVDPNGPSVSMLSIPRDLYLYIPSWKMARVNTADFYGERAGYPGGGPGLVKATIEYNLGIRVHYFARADFQGFVKILDTLGGIDVVVDCELHDTFPDPAAASGASDLDLMPGVHHLDGKQALWYARSRWNTSDYDRGRRQQRVLRSALAKIKQMELLPRLPELWDELIQTVETDLSLETALWLAQVAGRLSTEMAIKSRFIDNTVLQNWRTPDGAAVLLPDPDRVGPLVADALAPPDTARSRQSVDRVEVLNGTTWPNWAILAADRLLWEGFKVTNISEADRADYQKTLIFDNTETDKGSSVSFLADVLRADNSGVVQADSPSEEFDYRVIVGYDYNPCYKTYWRAVHGPTPTPAQ